LLSLGTGLGVVIGWVSGWGSFFELRRDFAPGLAMLGAAADAFGGADAHHWAPDDVISPADTRRVLAAHLRAVLGPSPVSHPGRTLRTWPVGF
jgi:hypothetical protein